jgi:hypothetical protein
MKFIFTSNRSLFLLLLTFLVNLTFFAQVGINTTNPGDGSILDVESGTKGILIPRISIPDLSNISPIVKTTAAEESLLVYNTNTTTGKGFHYWDGTQWIAISFKDGDFYKEGTSSPPTSITDHVYRTGNVAIGKTSANSALDITDNTSLNAVNITSTGSDNILNIQRTGSKSGTSRGIYVNYTNDDPGSADQMAIQTWLRAGSGSGRRYGLYNNVNATVGNNRQLVGVYNKLRDGNGSKWGMWNNMSTTENGDLIGVYTQADNGIGHHQGIKNTLEGTADNTNTGTGNYISNTGNGYHVGNYNLLSGGGNGVKIAVRNQISAGAGTNYGTYNDINFTASGQSSYGTWNEINTDNGTNYAGWFDSFGTGGVHYAAVFNRGDVVVNESASDSDVRIEGMTDNDLFFTDASTDRVGIGTNSPTEKFEVNGKIKATDINFSGIPSYGSDSAANSDSGLASGDVYRVGNDLRIKL